ncbi:SurA N-terminal domain-containing protein [Actinocorallia lasiicapitis]
MGAAATLSDGRISDATLNDAVAEWQAAYKETPLPAQQLQLAADDSIDRSVLSRLISIRIADRAAADNHLQITPAEIDSVIAQVSRGGGEKVFDTFALAYGVPPTYARDFARMITINDELAVGATTQEEAQQKVGPPLKKASDALGIVINPRYGEYKDGMLAPPVTKLSRPETGTS